MCEKLNIAVYSGKESKIEARKKNREKHIFMFVFVSVSRDNPWQYFTRHIFEERERATRSVVIAGSLKSVSNLVQVV